MLHTASDGRCCSVVDVVAAESSELLSISALLTPKTASQSSTSSSRIPFGTGSVLPKVTLAEQGSETGLGRSKAIVPQTHIDQMGALGVQDRKL